MSTYLLSCGSHKTAGVCGDLASTICGFLCKMYHFLLHHIFKKVLANKTNGSILKTLGADIEMTFFQPNSCRTKAITYSGI